MAKSIRNKIGLLLFFSMFVLTLLLVAALQYHSYVRLRHAKRQVAEANILSAMEVTDEWLIKKIEDIEEVQDIVDRSPFSRTELLKQLKLFADKKSWPQGHTWVW